MVTRTKQNYGNRDGNSNKATETLAHTGIMSQKR